MDKAAWGQAKTNIKVFLFLACILEVDGLNCNGLKGRSSPRALVYSPVDGSKCHLSPRWLVREKVWLGLTMHPCRCREHTLQETKRRKQQHKNKKLSKFHSGTNVTAPSGATEAPDDGPMTLDLWRRPQMAVMSIQNGSVGLAMPFTNHCPLLIRGQRSRGAHASSSKRPSCREIMRCHIRLLWSREFSNAVRALHICSLRSTSNDTRDMMAEAHDWQFGREQMKWHCSRFAQYFFLLLKHDVFLTYCTFPRGYISEFDKKGKNREIIKKTRRKGKGMDKDAKQLNVCLTQNDSLAISAK